MKNVDMTVEGDRLVITVDLSQEFGVSKTGKSITIASGELNTYNAKLICCKTFKKCIKND